MTRDDVQRLLEMAVEATSTYDPPVDVHRTLQLTVMLLFGAINDGPANNDEFIRFVGTMVDAVRAMQHAPSGITHGRRERGNIQ